MESRSSRSRFGTAATAASAAGGGGGAGGGGERVVEWTCHSCTAVAVADCVALGCCPCAVVSMLTLTLVRVPWAVSRRCLRVVWRRLGSSFCRRRRRRRVRADEEEKRRTTPTTTTTTTMTATTRAARSPSETVTSVKKGVSGAGEAGGDELLGSVLGVRGGEVSDKVWIEFYQIGQWGFGRLSFSGIKTWDWGS